MPGEGPSPLRTPLAAKPNLNQKLTATFSLGADCLFRLPGTETATIVTGDPDFRQIEHAVSIECLPADSG